MASLGQIAVPVSAISDEAKASFANKEHLDIYLNKNVANVFDVIESSDKLVLLYIFHSENTVDEKG